ncbi:hypothetical protein B0G52_11443 [Cohnella sp. SGD-V74]|uniref:hypothetical protein n=1 Tax=unclassified Cohnella TaxID=2636738 RepID=UPI000D4B743F|nr:MULTISPECIES: hypothetical protein [unclassified Cohnella]PRX67824.1 hypothetical protein B0G52_11443 [Cohnella sp. SGD-V74]
MRIGASRRNAGTVPAKAALAGAGPAHARFAGEIAGKYGPIRPGVRSGQPLVFRVSSQEKGKSAGKGRERTPFRPPERSSVAGPVTPAREKPEIRYRDIVRDRPGPAGKDRVIEREKVVERQKLVEREKVVEREKIVERSTVVVREAVRVVVEQRRIRETALSTDLNGRSEEAAEAVRESSASVRGANKSRKSNKRMPENKQAASAEEEARTLGIDDEDGGSFGNELSEAPRREASPAARTSLAETLAQRTSWPMSAKANAAFRRDRDQAPAAKIPLRAKASSAPGKRKKAADRGKAKESAGSSQVKKPQAVYAQLLFLNPKLRVDGGKRSGDGGANPSGADVRASRRETPSPGEAAPQTERPSGSAAAHGNAEPSSARQTEAQRESERFGGSASSRRELSADVPRLTETRDAGGRLESGERVGEDAVGASRDAGKRRSDKAARRQARQEQTSQVDDTPSSLSVEGSSTSADGGVVSDEEQEHARSWSRRALRLSHALRPGTTRFEESSSSGVAKEASSLGRMDDSQAELGERLAQPKVALGVRSWSLRRPGADSPLPLVYRSMTERERPIAAKRTIGLGMKTAATQAASAGSAASESVRESRRLPQAETKLGLATGSLKLAHRLTRSSTGGAAGRNASSASGEVGQQGLSRANGAGTTGASLAADRGPQVSGDLTGKPGRDSAGNFQTPTIHANARVSGETGLAGEGGRVSGDGTRTPTVHANARVSGTSDRADDRGQGAGDGARTPKIHAKARVSGASDRVGDRGQGSGDGARAPTVHAKAQVSGASDRVGDRGQGSGDGTRAPTVHANAQVSGTADRAGDRGQGSGDGVRSNEGGYQAGLRATPVHANIRGTRVSSRISDKAGLRNPGLVNAGLSGARGRSDQGKLVLLARRDRMKEGGAEGRRSALNRSGTLESSGMPGQQRNLLIPTDGPDRLAVNRQSGRPLSPAAQAESQIEARTSIQLRRGPPPENGPNVFANPRLPAVRRGEMGADAMRPISESIRSQGANGEVSAGWQRDRSPMVQRGRRVPLSTVMSTGRMARATLPKTPATHPMRQSLREPLLPNQQDSSAQLDRSDAPRLSLAHAALPGARERRDAAVPGNAADSSVHTHEPDTPLEFRRNATVTAAANQARNAAPEPAAEISEEALQKAISALPQLHPDQLADQVYKSLMKRMKMEQRLHGF